MAAAATPFPRELTALSRIHSLRNTRIIAALMTATFFITVLGLLFVPWQQNVPGKGRVVAYAPLERRQNIEAPVDGRIAELLVMEGSTVKKGDLIARIADNDPNLLDRLGQERSAALDTLRAENMKIGNLEQMVLQLRNTRDKALEAAQSRIDVADDKIRAAQQSLDAAEADHLTARLNYDRQRSLSGKGLTSARNVELATLQFNKTKADVDKARASLNAERNSRIAAVADRERINADALAKIQDAQGYVASARSSAAKAQAEIAKVDVRVARQNTQVITAPSAGVILRVTARQGGEFIKAGHVLAELVPESSRDVVEIWVDGNDAPLVAPGRTVRLQFEGWPALQFAGWPGIAVGTFGGRVLNVDAADDGNGNFRLLVEPDPNDDPWPSKPWLRQGVQANGWVLLNQVPVGYEIWRQFNGFPPTVAMKEPAPAGKGGK